jgi:hypothetical protein
MLQTENPEKLLQGRAEALTYKAPQASRPLVQPGPSITIYLAVNSRGDRRRLAAAKRATRIPAGAIEGFSRRLPRSIATPT